MTAHQALSQLLIDIFDAKGLRRFVRYGRFGEKIDAELPHENSSPVDLADAVVITYARWGLIDNTLFDMLEDVRPAQSKRIRAVQEAFSNNEEPNRTPNKLGGHKKVHRPLMLSGVLLVVVSLCAAGAYYLIKHSSDSPYPLEEICAGLSSPEVTMTTWGLLTKVVSDEAEQMGLPDDGHYKGNGTAMSWSFRDERGEVKGYIVLSAGQILKEVEGDPSRLTSAIHLLMAVPTNDLKEHRGERYAFYRMIEDISTMCALTGDSRSIGYNIVSDLAFVVNCAGPDAPPSRDVSISSEQFQRLSLMPPALAYAEVAKLVDTALGSDPRE